MELSKTHLANGVQALRSYRAAKKQYETAQQNLRAKLDKVRECFQASGTTEEQVMVAVNQSLATAYMELPEGLEA